MFKVNYRNTRARCEISQTIKTAERRQWCRRSHVFIINFEHISHLTLVFLLLTLSRYLPTGKDGKYFENLSFYSIRVGMEGVNMRADSISEK